MTTLRAFLLFIASCLPLLGNAAEAEFYYEDADASIGVWSVKADKRCAVQIHRKADSIWYGNLNLEGGVETNNSKNIAFAILSKYLTFPKDFRGTIRLKFLKNKQYLPESLEIGVESFPYPNHGMLVGYIDREKLLKVLSQNDEIEYQVDDAKGESTGIKRTYLLHGSGAANLQFLKCEAFVSGELDD